MSEPLLISPARLRENYRRVVDRVAEAALRCGRRPSDVLIVAVTKYASPDQIRLLAEMGHQDFGENRVQQLVQRAALLEEFLARRRRLGHLHSPETSDVPAPGTSPAAASSTGETPPVVRWHMVGHLQRNKIKQIVPVVRLIHSVDTLRLAEELHNFASRINRTVEILLQVNVSGEPTKFGVAPPAALHLAQQIDSMLHLRLRGLMTIAPLVENPEDARPVFARAAELFHEIRAAGVARGHFNILSMGMSNDFEVAIQEGANLVRIGTAIFGSGPQSPADQSDETDRREEPSDEDLPAEF